MKRFPRETNRAAAFGCALELLDVVPAIMRAIRTHMREVSAAELSVPQFRTLRYISCRPGRSLSDVAEHIGLSLPSMSKIVQQLLTRGYVSRAFDRADRRRSILAPTPKGQRVLNAAREAARGYLAESLAGLGDDGCRAILEAMRVLRTAFMPELGNATDPQLQHRERAGNGRPRAGARPINGNRS